MIRGGYRPKVGEDLIVVVPSYSNGVAPTVTTGRVQKVGREWVHFAPIAGLHEPKFRIRTQYTENRTSYNAHYLTKEQWDSEQRWLEARLLLQRHGVQLDSMSPFRKNEEKLIELADAVRRLMEADHSGQGLRET